MDNEDKRLVIDSELLSKTTDVVNVRVTWILLRWSWNINSMRSWIC